MYYKATKERQQRGRQVFYNYSSIVIFAIVYPNYSGLHLEGRISFSSGFQYSNFGCVELPYLVFMVYLKNTCVFARSSSRIKNWKTTIDEITQPTGLFCG